MSDVRIINQTTITELSGTEFLLVDDSTNGTNKITPDNLVKGTDSYTDLKSDLGDLEDLETTDKSSLVNAINEARGSSGSGLTADIKTALLQIASKVAYIDDDGQTYYDALEDALYPPADLVSISAVYSGGDVYNTATLDSLKSNLVVTAHYDDSSTETVSSYTLSGTIATGSQTITVTYGGKTTTFSITVIEWLTGITATYTQSGTVYDTASLDDLKADLVVTATYADSTSETITDYTLSGTLTEGTSTITVAYGGKTATFNVTVTHQAQTVTIKFIDETYVDATLMKTNGTTGAVGYGNYIELDYVDGMYIQTVFQPGWTAYKPMVKYENGQYSELSSTDIQTISSTEHVYSTTVTGLADGSKIYVNFRDTQTDYSYYTVEV